jgi:uncharacterized integral membrane protein
MRKFFTALIVIPLAVIFVVFAVANRHFVTISFDPFNSADPSLAADVRLFWVVFAAAFVGVIVGGCATWFGQRRWRRGARQHEADARTLRAQLAELRSHAAATRGEPQRRALPGAIYGTSGRDKQGATL